MILDAEGWLEPRRVEQGGAHACGAGFVIGEPWAIKIPEELPINPDQGTGCPTPAGKLVLTLVVGGISNGSRVDESITTCRTPITARPL